VRRLFLAELVIVHDPLAPKPTRLQEIFARPGQIACELRRLARNNDFDARGATK
jgi:hypothetical protein